MHRLPTQHSVTRFKLAAWALLLMAIAFSVSLGTLLYSVVTDNRRLTLVSLWLVAGAVIVAMLQWLVSSRPRCPLCHARPIAWNGCSKHRTAKRLLGSHRLRVACSVIFRKCFTCPYCGESTVIQARTNRAARSRP